MKTKLGMKKQTINIIYNRPPFNSFYLLSQEKKQVGAK